MPSINDPVAAEAYVKPKKPMSAKKQQRIVNRLRKKCAKAVDGVLKLDEPASTPLPVGEVVPESECANRVERTWNILKAGILDPEQHKDAWLINTAEAQTHRGQFGTVLHPKWQPAPDCYFFHDPEIDALLVMDRSERTLVANKRKPMMFGVKRDQCCCCDSPAHLGRSLFKIPLLNRGDCRTAPLPHLQGEVVER